MNNKSLILSFVMVLIVVLVLVGVYFYLNKVSIKGSITRDVLPNVHLNYLKESTKVLFQLPCKEMNLILIFGFT